MFLKDMIARIKLWYFEKRKVGSIYIPVIVKTINNDPENPTFTLVPQLRFDEEELFRSILTSFGDILEHYIDEINDVTVIITEYGKRDFYYNPMTGLFLLRIGCYTDTSVVDFTQITREEYSDMERLDMLRGYLVLLKGIVLHWCPNVKVV